MSGGSISQRGRQTPFGYLSCPTASLCVDSHGGDVLTATRPAGRASAWKQTTLSAGVGIGDLVCPSATECVGPDGVRGVVTSTNPTGGSAAWPKVTTRAT